MKHPIVVGLQFGDEGKGKLTDQLAQDAEWVIRFNGGSNAGHTLTVDGQKVVTHCIPSGVMYSHCQNFIGSGCVLEANFFQKEVDDLAAVGVQNLAQRLKIDFRAHVTLPLHLAIEAKRESGQKKFGSTKKGIAPTYATKAFKFGIRMGELVQDNLHERVKDLCENFYDLAADQGESLESFIAKNIEAADFAKKTFSPFLSTDIAPFYSLSKSTRCLLEGAQAVMLDVDHGTYPWVTSSNTVGSYAAVGGPFPYRNLGSSIGVAKAYMTRVGEGPFETEIQGELAEKIRDVGGEYGATTGRPRRIGWLNLQELNHAIKVSDCYGVFMTKADVLSTCEKVKVLDVNGNLKEFDSWDFGPQTKELPASLKEYVDFVEAQLNVPVIALGTGPGREDVFWLNKIDFWE